MFDSLRRTGLDVAATAMASGSLSSNPALQSENTRPAVQTSGVDLAYPTVSGDRIQAVKDLNLAVAPGDFYVLVGPSGCGKSTVLRLLAGLLVPTGGNAELSGERLPNATTRTAFVFQEANLLPWLTVLENTVLPCRLGSSRRKPRAAQREDRGRAQDLLNMVGLESFADRYPAELSGGMRQRASLARALASQPQLLLMDEPFGALDAITRELMNVELARIWSLTKVTIVFVTHSITEAVFLGDRVGVMRGHPGTIVTECMVDLPRPRTLASMVDPSFSQLVATIRGHLFDGAASAPAIE